MDKAAAKGHISDMKFTVTVEHDQKEGVWFVQDSNVPGLNAEASSLDALIEVITDLAPELVASNVPRAEGSSISVCVQHLVNPRKAYAA